MTDYGNENYHALDNNTVHMPSTGVVHANGQGGGPVKGKKSGLRGLVRYGGGGGVWERGSGSGGCKVALFLFFVPM